jgi:hypothetical protein
MKTRVGIFVLMIVLLAGCNKREQELQKQLSQVQVSDSTKQQNIIERDKYMEQVILAVNEANQNLQKARLVEGGIAHRTPGVEGASTITNVTTRDNLLVNLRDISTALKENRRKIGALQMQNKKFGAQMASLDTMIETLKTSIQERETSIAQMQARIQGLETNVAENNRTIVTKDSVIGNQIKTINTGFYVVGTREALKKKGIITEQGGFLWGLLGSTTVLTDSLESSGFMPIDVKANQPILVDGKIDQILPNRNASTFETDKNGSTLNILNPDKFWRERYLVIVVGG